MDIEFEHGMQRLLHAHMEDARNHFVKHKAYPTRAFIYTGYEFTDYHIDPDRIEEEMREIQNMALSKDATAVSLIGVFDLLREEREALRGAAKPSNEQDSQKFRVLAVVMKLMDGKTFLMAQEIVENEGDPRLDEAAYFDSDHFFDVPIKPWGN